jgi:hypothetical protein
MAAPIDDVSIHGPMIDSARQEVVAANAQDRIIALEKKTPGRGWNTRRGYLFIVNTNRRHLAAWAGLVLWSGLLVLICYGPALGLPFLTDDFFRLPYAAEHSLTQIWQSAEGLTYYRPFSVTLWKLMHLIFGRHEPIALHALNLLLHWGNGLMVAWLAGHLWSMPAAHNQIDWRRRYVSATLFLLYPFSYEAVPWIAAIMHPLGTALILLSVISYLKMRATRLRAWGLLSLGFAFLSPFAHENGALVGALIVTVELTQPSRSEPLWRSLRRAALWFLPALLWWLIWRQVPVEQGPESLILNDGEKLVRNSLYFAQGTAYPLTWLGGWLRNALGVNGFVAAAGLSVWALSGAAFVQWRTGADRRAWLPWLWIGVAAAPAVFFLRPGYVSGSPRMMMLASVGVAWLWTDVLVRLMDWSQSVFTHRRLGAVLIAGLCSALLVQNYSFIRDRMQIYEMGGSAVRQAAAVTAAANEAGQTAIFINLPVWIAPHQVVYAMGQEGVLFFPGFVPLQMLTVVYTGRLADIRVIRSDAIRQEVPYYSDLVDSNSDWESLAKSGGRVFATRYAPDQIVIQPVGALNAAAPVSGPIAHFGNVITLLDAAAAIGDGHMQVDLTWEVREPPPPEVTVFVHVFDANGQLIAQADGDPLAGAYPFWRWPHESIVLDRRSIEVGGTGLSLRVGLYNRATGERLSAVSSAGAWLVDDAVQVPIRIATGSPP